MFSIGLKNCVDKNDINIENLEYCKAVKICAPSLWKESHFVRTSLTILPYLHRGGIRASPPPPLIRKVILKYKKVYVELWDFVTFYILWIGTF